MRNIKVIYVGDFGAAPVSDVTLAAYSVEFLKGDSKVWRRSSKKRSDVARYESDMAAIQRYFWMRNEDREQL